MPGQRQIKMNYGAILGSIYKSCSCLFFVFFRGTVWKVELLQQQTLKEGVEQYTTSVVIISGQKRLQIADMDRLLTYYLKYVKIVLVMARLEQSCSS